MHSVNRKLKIFSVNPKWNFTIDRKINFGIRSSRRKDQYTSSDVAVIPYKMYCFCLKKKFGQPSFFFSVNQGSTILTWTQPEFLQRKLRTSKKGSEAGPTEQPQPRYEPIDYEENLDFSLQVAPSGHVSTVEPDSPVKSTADQFEQKVSHQIVSLKAEALNEPSFRYQCLLSFLTSWANYI